MLTKYCSIAQTSAKKLIFPASVKTFVVPVEVDDSYLQLPVLGDLVNAAIVKSMATDNCKLFFVS